MQSYQSHFKNQILPYLGEVNHFSRILKREGLNAHSFRHTHTTQLIEPGAKPTDVAGRLGYANVNIAQNLYTHNTQKLRADTADIFAKSLQTKH